MARGILGARPRLPYKIQAFAALLRSKVRDRKETQDISQAAVFTRLKHCRGYRSRTLGVPSRCSQPAGGTSVRKTAFRRVQQVAQLPQHPDFLTNSASAEPSSNLRSSSPPGRRSSSRSRSSSLAPLDPARRNEHLVCGLVGFSSSGERCRHELAAQWLHFHGSCSTKRKRPDRNRPRRLEDQWRAQHDSNMRPSGPQPDALSN